ncbi:hypothetical protein [Bacillus sp. FJAT-29937]|uniref:hypothetical protein n=1 Tax=Bacillus sp. FJAT-29937 TaxID=1720553 RepID=UPI000834BC99|nr:hypothetical protein [Bacillus sp. FJAT-29937]
MLKMTGWKDIDELIISSHKLREECSELDKRIEQINKFSPIKTYRRTPGKTRFMGIKKRNVLN